LTKSIFFGHEKQAIRTSQRVIAGQVESDVA